MSPFLLFLITLASSPVPPEKAQLETLSHQAFPEGMAMLRALLKLPNDAHYPAQMKANIDWSRSAFQQRGFTVQALQTPTLPLLLASRQFSGAKQTLLIYLQIDGQPVDPETWHQADPYDPVIKIQREGQWQAVAWPDFSRGFDPEARIFARSASDAKGPVAMLLAALDVLDRQGWLPQFNIKVIMDFEEELGSPQLAAAVQANRDKLASDCLLIFDGPRHSSNRPTLIFGARGIMILNLKVFGPVKAQHSGHFGNYLPNPALKLSRLLTSMKDEHGKVVIPGFYDGIDLNQETRKILAQTPDNETMMLKNLGIRSPDQVGKNYQESIQFPSLNILGLASGWTGKQTRTIVPADAEAVLDIRLVPESDPQKLLSLVRRHIQEQGFHFITGEEPSAKERADFDHLIAMNHQMAYGAFRTTLQSPYGNWLTKAMRRAFDADPVRIRISGGSVPVSPFVVALGVPAILVPTVNKDNNQHSPNENLRLGNFQEGIQTFLAILTEPLARDF